MYPRSLISLLVAAIVAVSSASPEDDALSRLVVGQWQGGRHGEEYFADGTWRFLPEEGTTSGTWRIADGRFVKSWAAAGSAVYDIVRLDATHWVLRGADGTIFTHERIVRRNQSRDTQRPN